MKIIFALPDLGSGGAERVVSLLSNELIQKGHDVDILMLFGNRVQYTLNKKVRLVKLNLAGLSLWKRIASVRIYLKSVISHKHTVLVPFQDSVLNTLLASSCGLNIPIVACERNNPYIKGTSVIRKLRAMIPYWLSDHCVFQTPDARSYYSLISNERCSVITNPITVPDFTWKGNFDEKHLISICRLHKQKNIQMTFDVIQSLKRKYPNIHLDIYGEGELKEQLQKQIEERGLCNNINLCGTTSQVISKLAESSIFISTSDFEGISNSMLEAMAVGVPMVCTDCPIGGARLMLSCGAGLLSPVGDVKIFVKKVDNLLSDNMLAKRMSSIAIAKAKQYTLSGITEEWLDVFTRIVR